MTALKLGFLLASLTTVEAQICHPDSTFGSYRHEWQISAGYSPASATLYGKTTDREFLLAGLRYGYRCRAWGRVSLSFTPAIFPVAVTFQPHQTFTDLQNGRLVQRTLGPRAVYGIGFAPLGFTLYFARERKVQPLIEALLGVHAATEPIPRRGLNATGLNFLLSVGAGLSWRVRESNAIDFGYRFFHLSNASTTPMNPGLDNNVIYVGWSFLR